MGQLNILGVIQARTSSSRLPGKAMMPIMGRPMLALQIERLSRATSLDGLIVATSREPSDDVLAELCREIGIECFRGSLRDVLDRHYRVIGHYRPRHLLRVGGDCPIMDRRVVDRVAALHLDGGYDFSSNVYPPTFPDGIDIEIFTASMIERLWRETELPSEREHISPYVVAHPEKFRIGNLTNGENLEDLRLTVDEPEDFQVVRRIFESLYPTDPDFSFEDAVAALRADPELIGLNGHFVRNAGRRPSLEADRAYRRDMAASVP